MPLMPRTPHVEAVILVQVEDPHDPTAWLLLRHEDGPITVAYPFPSAADVLHTLRTHPVSILAAATDGFRDALSYAPDTFPAMPRTRLHPDGELRGDLAGLPWVPLHLLAGQEETTA